MLKRIDSSKFVVRFLERLSTLLARRRGLPTVIGIVLIILGFVVELISIAFGIESLAVVHVILRDLGVLVALIGLVLSEPLGA